MLSTVRRWLTVSTLATLAAVAYVVLTFSRISSVVNPLTPVTDPSVPAAELIAPAWRQGTPVQVFCYLSPYDANKVAFDDAEGVDPAKLRLLWNVTAELGVHTEVETSLLLRPENTTSQGVAAAEARIASASEGEPASVYLPKTWWRRATKGQGAFIHIIATRSLDATAERPVTSGNAGEALYSVVPLVRLMEPTLKPPKRHLLCDVDVLQVLVSPENLRYCSEEFPSHRAQHARRLAERARTGRVSDEAQWVPEVGIRLLSEFRSYLASDGAMVQAVLPVMRNPQRSQSRPQPFLYQPLMHADEVGLTSDKYVSLNKTTNVLPVRLTLGRLSLVRFRLMSFVGTLLSDQKDMGFNDQDVDDVRRLVADTSVSLLAITVIASVLHLLFEFLAFRSDVNFWRQNKSLRGLSVRAVAVELLFQLVVLLFLYDEGASLLVLGPAAIGVAIQAWKVQRAMGVTISLSRGLPRMRFLRLEEEEALMASKDQSAEAIAAREWSKLTQQVDRMAWGTLALLVVPLVVGLAWRSLLMDRHVSWYSWLLSTLTAAVYGFGFALMTPQLIINHRLKSVAALPWRFLCYRSLNTFIDDLFAFVIKMPTMHRVSCFRDDIVFFLYIGQRWSYPVDTSRPVAGEDMGG